VAPEAAACGARVVVTARGALSDIWDRDNCFAYTAISQGTSAMNQPYTELETPPVSHSIRKSRTRMLLSGAGRGATPAARRRSASGPSPRRSAADPRTCRARA
jgi:hypothetical protein